MIVKSYRNLGYIVWDIFQIFLLTFISANVIFNYADFAVCRVRGFCTGAYGG